MSLPGFIGLADLNAAQDLLQHWQEIRVPLSEDTVAAIQYSQPGREVCGPFATYRRTGLPVSLDDATPDVLRRYLRLLEVVQDLNAGRTLLAAEVRAIGWTPDAGPMEGGVS